MSEAWLHGPVEGVAPTLMPAAHSLLQVRDEIGSLPTRCDPALVWMAPPGGAGSIGFHLRHLAGSLDRLCTYARGDALDAAQLAALASEAQPPHPTLDELVRLVHTTIDRALAQIRATDPATIFDRREVGRQRLPSTVVGLLFHAGEHSLRHAGQIATTVKILAAAPRAS